MDLPLGFVDTLFYVTGVMDEADNAFSIWSYWPDQFLTSMDFVESFNVSLDLSSIYLLSLMFVDLPLCVVFTPS